MSCAALCCWGLLTVRDRSEPLLARSVPHLYLDRLATQLHSLQTKVDTTKHQHRTAERWAGGTRGRRPAREWSEQ